MTPGYSASGGHASSGGDTSQSTGSQFGGLTYNRGINPTHIAIAAVVGLGLYVFMQVKK